MKNPIKPSGIESANFRFVAQRLNHCATAANMGSIKNISAELLVQRNQRQEEYC